MLEFLTLLGTTMREIKGVLVRQLLISDKKRQTGYQSKSVKQEKVDARPSK